MTTSATSLAVRAQGFNSLPAVRQLGLMVGLAVSVALGVTVAMWSQTPNYSMLYGNLSMKDLSEVVQSLDSAGIKYKIEGSSGILVPADKLNEARMELASTSMSPAGVVGFEILDKDQGLGSNSFLLKARYKRAIEGELAQSITRLNFVEGARVHLAIPKHSAFARKKGNPAASVVLTLTPGWVIDDSQTASIVNIVASSVPGMGAEDVTVVDGNGRLLSREGSKADSMLGSTQFEYTKKLEERFVQRIIEIITPIVGTAGVRATVVADIDFTSLEETKERFLPENKAVRSEQLFEQNSNTAGASGIPGALSNQPPAGGTLEGADNTGTSASGNNSSRAVRNFEIDRTISHIRQAPAQLKRLSVAVILDYRVTIDDEGNSVRTPLNEDEMQRLTLLIKESVGLNEARGDTIKIINTSFQQPEVFEPLPEQPVWQQPWVLTLAKQVIGGLIVLLIAFGILRPMLSNLSKQGENVAGYAALAHDEGVDHIESGEDQLTLSNQQPPSGQQLRDVTNTMVKEDPKRVAQVLNSWVESDG